MRSKDRNARETEETYLTIKKGRRHDFVSGFGGESEATCSTCFVGRVRFDG
jgi:hypothetical protein